MLTPRPYQKRSIDHLKSILNPRQPGIIDGSDCGTGKTLVATELMKWMNRPTAVVCPKVVIPSWHRHAEAQGTSVSPLNWDMIRTGRTPFGTWEKSPTKRVGVQQEDRSWQIFKWNSNIKFLIFDEVHRAMSYESKNSELVRAARRQRIPALALSATLADSPLELDATGYLLGLHDGDAQPTVRNPAPNQFLDWARKNNCRPGHYKPFEFYGDPGTRAEVMARIHSSIYPSRGVRVRIADLGAEFPETQITTELYSLGDADALRSLYERMAVQIAELKKRQETDRPSDLTDLLRSRQEIELLKVPGVAELARSACDAGKNVAIFVNFTATLRALCEQLETTCFIDGSQTGAQGAGRREFNRRYFQDGLSNKIICNSEAGGLGLDLQGLNREALILPGYNVKTLRQVCGRVHRHGGGNSVQRILLAAGTVEEKVFYAINRKGVSLDALNDGDLDPL